MQKELIVENDPKSPIAESFRTLRTNIQFINSKKDLKTILFTSTMPREGKSWITANLAVAFAQSDKRVLLVDADMRKGRQHTIFKISNTPGLSNYLSGVDEQGKMLDSNLNSIIKPTDVFNLYLLPSGNFPPNPSELLSSEMMIRMIEQLKQLFDVIIFDGTPNLLVTDSIILSRLVDSTIIVVEHNITKKDNLLKIKKNIENVGGKISGVIINKVPVNVKSYNNKYYYSSTSMVRSKKDRNK